MADNKPTDYAALIQAAQTAVPKPPEWLAVGKYIYSLEHGLGEVVALLGKRLIVQFLEDVSPIHFADWPLAVERSEIISRSPATASSGNKGEVTSDTLRISPEQISRIPLVSFQAIAYELASNLVAIDITEGQPGVFHLLPPDLPLPLCSALERIGVTKLYSHQVEALNALRAGLDLSVLTPTASGKTMCYNLAVLESCLNQPHTTALYIFPLKALALDQMRKLRQLTQAMPSDLAPKVGLMTGDTPKHERQQLFIPNPPNILAVSPDLLHHYLYNVRRRDDGEPWREFLRRLRWIVIDESHTYVGAFGAHFANLMRRLRLAVDRVDGNSNRLQYIFSSATIGNPEQIALRFSGRVQQPEKLHLINCSGAESLGRTLLCLAPSSAANPDAGKIIIAWLQHGLTGIVFCNSRAAVKNLMGIIQRETQRQGLTYLARQVAIFYGSLTGDRRREIIQRLQQGEIKVLLSTSALEAGIDLPELDCCLIRGYPGSLMSFWQRVGRAGRTRHGLVIFLPVAQDPLDAFYGSHPEQLLAQEVESAAFNPDYPTILGKHLECASVESGVPIAEMNSRFGNAAGAVADSLLQQDKLFLSHNNQLWGRGYPHKNINIRGSAKNSVDLIDLHTGEVFEQMSLTLAHREVFPGAIYTAQAPDGELIAYRCESLELEQSKAILAFLSKDTDQFTEAEVSLEIKPLQVLAEPLIMTTAIADARVRLTLIWGEISTYVTGYRLLTRENGITCTNKKCSKYHSPLQGKTCPDCKHPLHPSELTKLQQEISFEQPYQTQYQAPYVKVELNPPLLQALQTKVSQIQENIRATQGGAIPNQFESLWTCAPEFIPFHSMGHQVIKAVPMVVLSSSQDIDCLVDELAGKTVCYFFDTVDGGSGATEALFHQLPNFATKALALARACNCESGCPRCLTQHGCPQRNVGLHKDAGLFLLDAITQGH